MSDYNFQPSSLLQQLQQNANNDNSVYSNFLSSGVQNYGNYGKYASETSQLFDNMMNYGDFSYDKNKDQLFQMYKNQYIRDGKMAMQDALGKASANSGGYNSSYAQTAGQNTFNSYMKDLSAKGVETYENARTQWQQGKDDLTNRYSISNDAKNAESEAYYNQLNAYSDKANSSQSLYNNSYNNEQSSYNNQVTYDQNAAKISADQKYQNKMYKLQKKQVNGR